MSVTEFTKVVNEKKRRIGNQGVIKWQKQTN